MSKRLSRINKIETYFGSRKVGNTFKRLNDLEFSVTMEYYHKAKKPILIATAKIVDAETGETVRINYFDEIIVLKENDRFTLNWTISVDPLK